MSWDFSAELSRHVPGERSSLVESRRYCEYVAKCHYENFTVVSWLLPRALRPHFHAVYAWCRWADDLADEAQDLALLEWWKQELLACYEGNATHAVTVALAETVKKFAIPRQLFLDLLSAFVQDQHVKTYDTFDQLCDYCRRSADPVGRIVLYLFECFNDESGRLSDEICTGLQLANFWQDVARDAAIGRTYLPREDIEKFGMTPELIRFEVERTRPFFERGEALLPRLPRNARLDVTLFLRGGQAVLDAIEKQNFDVWTRRPVVSKWKKVRLMWGTFSTCLFR